MSRTNQNNVKGVLGKDYDFNGCPSLKPYIDTANAVVSRVQTCAIAKGITLSSSELELIERWLAAHYYTKSDPVYASKTTGKATASFVRGTKEPEPYKDAAINMDYSGCLNAILNRLFAHGAWLGTAQDQYDEANEP